MLRVAVIDSGVFPGHPHILAGRIGAGAAIAADGTISETGDATIDRLGHGTAVTAAIQELAPDALIMPVRVFHDALRTSARALVTAIDWAVDAGAGVINCSLGTANPAHAALFDAAVADALAAGVQVIAPFTGPDDRPCWPGQCARVIRVALDWDLPRGTTRMADGLVYASGYPRPIPGVEQRRNLHGISFATAQVSGLIAAGALDCSAG
jgi:subtilisin family serine protease